jgi:hypothetical protein
MDCSLKTLLGAILKPSGQKFGIPKRAMDCSLKTLLGAILKRNGQKFGIS